MSQLKLSIVERRDNDIVVIMAGGEGKRMKSNLPKVLHLFQNKPMILHILEKALAINPLKIYIIVGRHKDQIENTIKKYIGLNYSYDINDKIKYIVQKDACGTGDAIKTFCKNINYLKLLDTKVLILSGDVPLISIDTMQQMLNSKYQTNVLVSYTEKNFGYGRIIQKYDSVNKKYDLVKIVEEKDCTEEEKKIKFINTGIYSFNCYTLNKYIFKIENENSQSEYYLTDIFQIINEKEKEKEKVKRKEKEKEKKNNNVNIINLPKDKLYEVKGVNTLEQLKELEKLALFYDMDDIAE